MSITAEAVYENGMFKLQQPLPFAEREQVRVTVESTHPSRDRLPPRFGRSPTTV
jgi:predicted DNA-binding antitoxin AbrB/MazE fold protein